MLNTGKKARASRPSSKRKTKRVNLPAEEPDKLQAIAQALGISKGEVAAKLFVILPIFNRAKLAIELLVADDPVGKEYAESVLIDMEDLEIENLYEECRIDGIIEENKGAWIA